MFIEEEEKKQSLKENLLPGAHISNKKQRVYLLPRMGILDDRCFLFGRLDCVAFYLIKMESETEQVNKYYL